MRLQGANGEVRGQWFCHEAAALKIMVISHSFYASCLDRINRKGGSYRSYLPWMASPNISLHEAGLQQKRPQLYPASLFDCSEPYLKYMNSYLDLAMDKGWMRRADFIRVFHELQSKSSSSIDIYREAISLVDHWPLWQRDVFRSIVKSIVPLCVNEEQAYENGHSFSDHHFVGAVFTSIDPRSPYPDLTLNIAFSHELAHQVLIFYQHSSDLLENTAELVYSGIRKTLRPAISAFHAAGALCYMIETTKALIRRENDVCRNAYLRSKLAEYSEGLIAGMKALKHLGRNQLCDDIMNDFRIVMGS
jgi:hypothetical protein